MPTVRLGNTGIETSALGFGCADLFREPSGARRQRLLDVALDAGIRHFDVAPMYGLGLAEGELGRFVRGRRDRIVLATKFGIDPASVARVVGRFQGPLRRLLEIAPALGEGARPTGADPRTGAIGSLLYRSVGFDAEAARRSLERSLRALRTDHVDLLLLHEPVPGDVESNDVRSYLESARAEGRIRAWGVAGKPESITVVASSLAPRIPILQTRADVFERSLRRVSDVAQATILFGAIGRALPRILAHVQSDEKIRRRWSETVGTDCDRADDVAALLLRDALQENRAGAVLFSTIRVERIHAAAAAAMLESDPGLNAFRRLIANELRPLETRS